MGEVKRHGKGIGRSWDWVTGRAQGHNICITDTIFYFIFVGRISWFPEVDPVQTPVCMGIVF